MENTKQTPSIEERTRFFAQYWGQKVMYVGGKGLVEIGNGGWNLKHPDFFLQLKLISQITDEDVEELLSLVSFQFSSRYTNEQIKEEIRKSVMDTEMMPLNLTDYLRSKGYALPFMEYSVEELSSFGWVQF